MTGGDAPRTPRGAAAEAAAAVRLPPPVEWADGLPAGAIALATPLRERAFEAAYGSQSCDGAAALAYEAAALDLLHAAYCYGDEYLSRWRDPLGLGAQRQAVEL